MVRFDLTSFLATISFFISIALYIKKSLSFFDFLYFLLILEGVVFLAGAISINHKENQSEEYKARRTVREFISEKSISFPARVNQMRYFFGLFFLFTGMFINKLASI